MITENTKFQKMINAPSNQFDIDMKSALSSALENKNFEELVPVRDCFNSMSEKEYLWYVNNHSKTMSLDTVLNSVTEFLKNHLIEEAKKAHSPLGEMLTPMVIAIAPWNHEQADMNRKIRNLNRRSWQNQSRQERVLIKDMIIDAIEYKVKVANQAIGVLNRQINDGNKSLIFNEKTFVYELV